ncbi:MAG TPA: hypothetical protein VEA69_18475 [Tepidisphaeraceae bacterium]|nr:hypothetical protein [Tepidisphaeraceae bacterium]
MADVKIAALNAGSSGVGPGVLRDALIAHRLTGIEIALVDESEDVVFPLADIGRRIAAKSGVPAKLAAYTDPAAALDGAAFVILAPDSGQRARATVDRETIRRHDPAHLITDTGGVAGLAASLREVNRADALCAAIKRHCPSARLINVGGPVQRTCAAAHQAGVKTVGVSAASLRAYKTIWETFHDEPIEHPFDDAVHAYDLLMAGIGGLSFVLELWEYETGEDLYPRLRERLAAGRDAGQSTSARVLAETGYLPASGDECVRGFVVPSVDGPTYAASDSEADHRRWVTALAEMASGRRPWDALLAQASWERPTDLVAAITLGKPMTMSALNLVNAGQVPQLPAGTFVETPATVDGAGPVATPLALPDAVVPMLARACELSAAIVAAARSRSRYALDKILEADPSVTNVPLANRALDEILAANEDVVGRFE